jgi:predicted permease
MLALGVGANAAVFTVLKSVLLDALPYADPNLLVRVYARRVDTTDGRLPLSAGTIRDIANQQRSFQSLTAFQDLAIDGVYGTESGARTVRIAWVEAGFFSTLGVQPGYGRTFSPDDAISGLASLTGGRLVPDTARAVVVSYRASQQVFGGTVDVVGRGVRIEGVQRTVIGVLPQGFVAPMGDIDCFFAFDLTPVANSPIAGRGARWLGLIGRVKPGVGDITAQGELDRIGTTQARDYPRDFGRNGLTALPLRDAMAGQTRAPLLVLMTSAALVLLIACANLAGAFLSRTISRRKELAVRTALGAGRARLVRQLLTETIMLAIAGGAIGVGLAYEVLTWLGRLARPLLPAHAQLSLDPGVVAVTGLVALATGILCGIAPALSVERTDPERALRDEVRGTGESRHSGRLRGALIAGQLALCVSLLVGAGLLTRSLWAMTTAPLGFDPDRMLGFTVRLPPRDYPTLDDITRFPDTYLDRLRSLPGVNAAASASWFPTAVLNRMGFTIPGVTRPDAPPEVALYNVVSDDYFRALRIPVLEGRAFDRRDRMDAPTAVILNETMAHRYWPNGKALGARLRLGPNPEAPLVEVVGIVGDVRNDRTRPDAEPMLYQSARQAPWPFPTFLLRTSVEPTTLLRSVERELAAINPGLAMQRQTTLATMLGDGLATRRVPVMLMVMFGLLALLVATVGVYAMFANMAAAREREFGVRMALGSRPRAIAALVLRQGAGWMALGLAGGVVGTLVVVRLVRDLLYQVRPFDPVTLTVSVGVLCICAALALLVPVRRATRVDPTVALRAQ